MTTALATVDNSKYLALQAGEDATTIEDMLAMVEAGGGIHPRKLVQIKVPSGGGMSWAIPHPNGEQDARELVGVVLFAASPRIYYKYKIGKLPAGEADNGGVPDCASDDGITGYGIKGEGVAVECASCPLAQWGSAVSEAGELTKGKACPPRKALYMLLPDRTLPVVISLPQTSVTVWDNYAMSLLNVGQMPAGVETKLTLKREERGGNKFSVLIATKAGDLDVPTRRRMQAAGTTLKGLLLSSRER